MEQALRFMMSFDSSAAIDPSTRLSGSFNRYLHTIFFQRFGRREVGLRTVRELETLAVALDQLVSGALPQACDTLVQRWKALECSVGEQGWSVARHMELIPSADVSLATESERRLGARMELDSQRLTANLVSVQRRGGAGSGKGRAGRGGPCF